MKGWDIVYNSDEKFLRFVSVSMVSLLENCPFAGRLTILEQDAGLHFLLKVDTPRSDREMKALLASAGIRVHTLSEYYHDSGEDRHCLVVNYSGIRIEAVTEALERLKKIM